MYLVMCVMMVYQFKALRKGIIFPVFLWETLENPALTLTTSYTNIERATQRSENNACDMITQT